MLTVTDTGVTITLNGGRATLLAQPLFLVAFLTVIAIGVAMIWIDPRISVALLVVVAAISWYYTNIAAKRLPIKSGKLYVTSGQVVHKEGGKQVTIRMPTDGKCVTDNDPPQVRLLDAQGQLRHTITGFDHFKEAQVTQALLQGQNIGKQLTKIKLQESL